MAAPPAGVSESGGSGSGASTREFLHHERACGAGAGRAVDDDLEAIFSEIRKLSGEEAGGAGRTPGEEADDVELLLRKASELARAERAPAGSEPPRAPPAVPQIKITTPKDTNKIKKNDAITTYSKESVELKKITKDPPKDARFKNRIRPFSASVIDSKRKESAKINKITPNNSPKKSILLKQEELLEELKDTKERIKSLELLNVQLTDDNKVYRNKLDEVSEKHHILELKLAECEKFISRLGKEYENRKSEMVTLKENEGKLVAELSKEKNERKNLTIQHDKDKSVIQDLQRQCKEMELILRRKHPDSVSALIVASKSSTVEDNKRKLLEERIIRLEGEISDKENNFQTILMTLQDKFSDMKQKYESHIIDVERQLMDDRKVNIELKNRINKVNLLDAWVQTESKSSVQTISTQTFLRSTERLSSAVSRLSQNSSIIFSKLREDSYLIATIKGLQAELTTKQRTISKINRETEELRKSLRNLRKEKEVLHNFNPQTKGPSKQTKSVDNILARVNTEMEAELTDLRRQRQTIIMERDSLMQSLKRTNEEFIMLKKKRIQDLHTLQLSHEKELMQMNMQLFPLQEEIQLLNRTVEMLENRIKVADETLLKSKGYRIDQEAGGDNSSNVRRNETLKKRLEGY